MTALLAWDNIFWLNKNSWLRVLQATSSWGAINSDRIEASEIDYWQRLGKKDSPEVKTSRFYSELPTVNY
jgi:hypothetical protein